PVRPAHVKSANQSETCASRPAVPVSSARSSWQSPAAPNDVMVIVVSWNRPYFLRQTLDSLQRQTQLISADIFVVDNCSRQETVRIIESQKSLAGYWLLEGNCGINGALERVVPASLPQRYRYILFSDADMVYERPLAMAVSLLDAKPELAGVSLQN